MTNGGFRKTELLRQKNLGKQWKYNKKSKHTHESADNEAKLKQVDSTENAVSMEWMNYKNYTAW